MQKVIVSILALLVATALLYTGTGLQGTLIAVRADLEGFPLGVIGLFMSAFYGGFVVGCRYTPRLVERVGHIRTYTALASIASAVALGHTLVVSPFAWLALRALAGFCFAGVTMIIESWINEQATNATRGRILSVYRLVDLAAQMAGQVLLIVASPADFALFAMVSILASLALVPVALTSVVAPQPIARATIDLRKLFQVSPLAAFGCAMAGLGNTAFWAVAPVFAQRMAGGTGMVAAFMSLAIIGGVLTQWPLGLLSDRVDRRYVIIGAALLASLSGLAVYLLAPLSTLWMLAGAAAFGGFAIPLLGLCLAHANDHAAPGDYIAVNGGLLLLYGVGAIAGPVLAAPVMGAVGSVGLFAYTAAIHGLLALLGVLRLPFRYRPREKEAYVALAVAAAVPTGTPEAFEMDPRADGAEAPDVLGLPQARGDAAGAARVEPPAADLSPASAGPDEHGHGTG